MGTDPLVFCFTTARQQGRGTGLLGSGGGGSLELSELLLTPSMNSLWILLLGDLDYLSNSLAVEGDQENAVRQWR